MLDANFLPRRAALTPERTALTELATGRRYTYAELDARAGRAARFLAGRFGVKAGDRVAVLSHNSAAFVEIFYATLRLGAVLVPLNWRLAAPEFAHALGDSEPRVLAIGPEHAGTAAELRGLCDLPPLCALEGADVDGPSYEDGLAAAAASGPERAALAGDHPACIVYTSGTTGRAKGAVIPHRQILANCIATAVSWGLRADDASPVFTPLFHVGGLFAFMTPLHYLGGHVLVARGFDGERDLHAIEREGCTVILGVPTIFHMWRETEAYQQVDLSRVRFFCSGGAPCPPPLMQAWREEKRIVLRQGYGLTEVGPNCFSMTDAESVAKSGSVGKPIMHLEVELAGAGDGEVGELRLRGPQVFAGYWRNQQATDAALQDGWFCTGDLARRDGDGFYTIAGRAKEMIISGGENIYAAEVETAASEHPAVAEAALIGQPDPRWGEIGVLVVIRRPGAALSESELVAHCGARLARYKVPRRVIFAEDFPRTALGKPQKAALRERYLG